jgi:hypothetical protein
MKRTLAAVAWLCTLGGAVAAPFDRVAIDAPGELIITQGDAESVRIEAEDRVRPRLRTQVEGGTLVIGTVGSLQTNRPIRFHVTLRTLAQLRADGSAHVRIGTLRTTALTLQLRGSSRAEVAELQAARLDATLDGASLLQVQRGTVQRLSIALDDSAHYDAPGLHSDDAQLAVHGSSQARLHAARRLDAQASGSGRIAYSGTPRLTQRLADAAEVIAVSTAEKP